MKPLSATIFILTVIVAGFLLLCPIYFMFARSPWCIFMFLISWLPALIVAKIGLSISEAIKSN